MSSFIEPIVDGFSGILGALGDAFEALSGAALSFFGGDLSPGLGDINRDTARQQHLSRNSVESRKLVYGRAVVSGPIVYARNDRKRRWRYLVVVLADHPCEAVEQVWFGDKLSTEHDARKYSIRVHLGDPNQPADAELRSTFPDEWTHQHRLRGCTYLYIRQRVDGKEFPQGLTNIRALVRGKSDLYDPRTQTRGYSSNFALVLLDFIQSEYGIRAPLSLIDQDSFIAAANLSDEAVALHDGGSQPRYTINGIVDSKNTGQNNLQQLLTAGGEAFLSYALGRYRLFVGAYYGPGVHQVDESSLSGSVSVNTLPARRQRINTVRGTFVDPDNDYQVTDFSEVVSQVYRERDGEDITADLRLPYTNSHQAAQRIAKMRLLTSNGISARIPVKALGLGMLPGQVVRVNLQQLGWVDKEFMVTDWQPNGIGVSLSVREVEPSFYDWATAEGITRPPKPDTQLPDPRIIPAPTDLVVNSDDQHALLHPDGHITSSLQVTWLAPEDGLLSGYELQYRLGESDWQAIETANTAYLVSPVQEGAHYQVRVRSISNLGPRSDWVETQHQASGYSQPPAAPSSLSAEVGAFHVQLTAASTLLHGVSHYAFWANVQDERASAFQIGEGNPSFAHLGLQPQSTLYYWVQAVGAAGRSDFYPADGGIVATTQSDPNAPRLDEIDAELSGQIQALNTTQQDVEALTQGISGNNQQQQSILDSLDDLNNSAGLAALEAQLTATQAELSLLNNAEQAQQSINQLAEQAADTRQTLADDRLAIDQLDQDLATAALATLEAQLTASQADILQLNNQQATQQNLIDLEQRADDARAGIASAATAIAQESSARASLGQSLSSEIADNQAAAQQQLDTLSDAQSSQASRLDLLTARTEDTEAGVGANATAIAQESSARASLGQSLSSEIADNQATAQQQLDTLSDAQSSQASRLDLLTARTEDTEAGVGANATAIAQESSARASLGQSLSSEIADNQAAAQQQLDTLSDAQSSQASRLDLLTARTEDTEAGVGANATAIAQESSARASLGQSLSSEIADNQAAAQQQIGTLTNEQSSQAKLINSLNANIDHNRTVAEQQIALLSQEQSSQISRIDLLTSRTINAEAGIRVNEEAIAKESISRTIKNQNIISRINANHAGTQHRLATITDEQFSQARRLDTVNARIEDAEAEIGATATSNATAIANAIAGERFARANLEERLDSQIADNRASAQQQLDTLSDAQSSQSSRLDAITARTETAEAEITQVSQALTSESQARSTLAQTVAANQGDNSVRIDAVSSAVTDLQGVVDASVRLTVGVNGEITGFIIDGVNRSFVIDAERFLIRDGNSNKPLFASTPQGTHIDNLFVGNIESNNFAAGQSGYRLIRDTGSAELNNVTVRGRVEASSGSFRGSINAATITGGSINGATISGGTINGVNGTFNGTVYAQNLEGDVFRYANSHPRTGMPRSDTIRRPFPAFGWFTLRNITIRKQAFVQKCIISTGIIRLFYRFIGDNDKEDPESVAREGSLRLELRLIRNGLVVQSRTRDFNRTRIDLYTDVEFLENVTAHSSPYYQIQMRIANLQGASSDADRFNYETEHLKGVSVLLFKANDSGDPLIT